MVDIRAGNDRPIFQHTIKQKQSGAAISLTGATVTPKCFFTVTGNEVVLTNSVIDVDYATGQLSFQFDILDFAGAERGRIKFWYNIVFSDSDVLDTQKKYYKIVDSDD